VNQIERDAAPFGATPAQAVFAGMMIGPAQVGARIMEVSLLKRFHPIVSTRIAVSGIRWARTLLASLAAVPLLPSPCLMTPATAS
jgi:hypothetical protein